MRRSRGRGDATPVSAEPRPPALLRHPRRVLAVAFVVLVVLGVVGTGVESRLQPTSLEIPGTPSAQAGEMLRRSFGDSAPFAILLRGPAAAVDRQGPALIRALRRDPKVTTLSPWDRGSVQRLRPSPRRALILVDFHVGIDRSCQRNRPQAQPHPRRRDPPAGTGRPSRASPRSRGRSRTSRSAPQSTAS